MKKLKIILLGLGISVVPHITVFSYIFIGRFDFFNFLADFNKLIIYLIFVIIEILLFVIYLTTQINSISKFQKNPRDDELDSMLKKVIKLPKMILISNILLAIIIPQIFALTLPDVTIADRLYIFVLYFANKVFFSMPIYIIFLRAFEKGVSDIPFSNHMMSMNLSTRTNLLIILALSSLTMQIVVFLHNFAIKQAGLPLNYKDLMFEIVPIMVIALFFTFLNITLLMKGITQRIADCRNYALQLGNGELTQSDIEIDSRDELGDLKNSLNIVKNNTSQLIMNIKGSLKNTIDVKDKVLESSQSTSTSIEQISSNISSMNRQIMHLDEQITVTNGSANSMNTHINTLNNRINNQAAMVEESTAAISQMLSSIENISLIASSKIDATKKLKDITDEGGKRLKQTNLQIQTIYESIENIKNMTKLIMGIAAQTNLLAMNAAIEAAHAGDAGRGFSVVADEIRKLAETSSNNSKKINSNINNIIGSIEDATKKSDETALSFTEIENEIEEVINSLSEIATGVSELKIGSQQILTAVTELQEISSFVKEDAQNMTKETGIVIESISGIQQISTETRTATEEMASGTQIVLDEAVHLIDYSSDLDEASLKLVEDTNIFKINKDIND